MSESSKRPRPSGSFSPPSPPFPHYIASKPSQPNPQTPISPSSMVSSGQPGAGSSTPATSQSIHAATSAADLTQPTTIASLSFAKDESGDALMTDSFTAGGNVDAPYSIADDRDVEQRISDAQLESESSEHRRTNHDWHHDEPTARPEAIDSRLNQDMGHMFRVCEQVFPHSRPHSSQDLIKLFRLEDIATSVRRVDPATGEKINKIRKSYEGKVKELKIAGRNKAVSTAGQWAYDPESTELPLLGRPDEDFQAMVANPNPTSLLISKLLAPGPRGSDSLLAAALQMTPAKLPDRTVERYKYLIGPDDGKPKPTLADGARKPTGLPSQLSAAGARPPSPAVRAIARPERAGAKRRYNDSSFGGYGEGFADDDDLDSSDDRGMKKKRRKDFPVSSTLGQGPNYGVGLLASGMRR